MAQRGSGGTYYRIQSPDYLIEFDNTQNNANHVHSVVRDFKGDFGHDLLLTRDHNGTGFWARGLGELGTYLTDLAETLGESADLTDGALCSDPTGGDRVFTAGVLYA